MRPAESRTAIKSVQEFMDGLDANVLNRKILGNVQVRHLVGAAATYAALCGMGKIENAETTGQIYAGGVQAIASMGAAFGMISENATGGPENSARSTLNSMVVSATHFMVSQVEKGDKLYNKDGKYTGTIVNRYDENGKIVDSVPVFQVKEVAKAQAKQVKNEIGKMFINSKRQNG